MKLVVELLGGQCFGGEGLRLEGKAVGIRAGGVRYGEKQVPHGAAADLAAILGHGHLQLAVYQLGGGVLRGLVDLLLDLTDPAVQTGFIPLVGKDLAPPETDAADTASRRKKGRCAAGRKQWQCR